MGIHGQVIYINRATEIIVAWFSSQPVASAARNEPFRIKLRAGQAIAEALNKRN